MFDPQTRELIQRVQVFGDIKPENLPEYLARVFDCIVELRVAKDTALLREPAIMIETVSFLRSLGNSLESHVVLRPQSENRRSCAFVAAQAKRLLASYERALTANGEKRAFLHPDYVDSEISGMLLFLIAEQQSDALDVARDVESLYLTETFVRSALTEALINLVKGHLSPITDLVIPVIDSGLPLEVQASETLYRMILESVVTLARAALVFSREEDRFTQAKEILLRVKDLASTVDLGHSDEAADIPQFLKEHSFSCFAGPAHLAALLLPCIDFVREAAVLYTPTPAGASAAAWLNGLKLIASNRPYLWSNHRQAIGSRFLDNGTSTTCSFPTGAGKSTLSELRILSALSAGKSVVFIAPTNALVSQTHAALSKALLDYKVVKSLVAEDAYAEMPEEAVSVAVMTPERCLMVARLFPERFHGVGLIVFDECHLLHGSGSDTNRRGLDAMLALLYLFTICGEADWLFLSAMMSNAEEMANWIAAVTGRACIPLTLDWKPTRQARGCLVYDGNALHNVDSEIRKHNEIEFELQPKAFVSLKQTWNSKSTGDYSAINLSDQKIPIQGQRKWGRIEYLHKKNEVAPLIAAEFAKAGMKVLIFAHTKAEAGAIANRADTHLKGSRDPSKGISAEEQALLDVIASELGDIAESFALVDAHASAHHGLLLPSEREFVERRFRNPAGFRILAATATLAQGMNLPADAVIIVGGERYDPKIAQQSKIAAHDLLNAAGRAGRAGHVAQGFVLFVPQKVVGLYQQENKIDGGWFDIQRTVFAFSDQCLAISDPVQALLDEIQIRGTESPEAAYLLRRLPSFSVHSEDTAPAFLSKSLGAFQARQINEHEIYAAKVTNALQLREAALRDPAEFTWYAEVATRNGVPTELIQQMAAFLVDIDVSHDSRQLAEWILNWIFSDLVRIKPVFSDRLLQRYGSEMSGDLFGPKILDATFCWMEGGNLKQIQALRTGKKEKHLVSARKFVLQAIPELSFAIGLVAQTYRAGIDNGLYERMPIALAMISQCLREGLPTAEILALRYLMKDDEVSRASVLTQWNDLVSHVKPGDPYENFKDTIRRVAKACRV